MSSGVLESWRGGEVEWPGRKKELRKSSSDRLPILQLLTPESWLLF
jgi:hypothetical protein